MAVMRGTLRNALCLTLLAAPAGAQSQALPLSPLSANVHEARYGRFVIDHPCGVAGARFGESTVALDFDGNGTTEIAAGAYGEGVVYVFFGELRGPVTPYSVVRVFDALGPQLCPLPAADDRLGHDIAAGQFDGDAADELVVGAPYTDIGSEDRAGAVYVYGVGALQSSPLMLVSAQQPVESGELGNSVIVGDFNGDGEQDVAASATKGLVAGVAAGKCHIFYGPLDANPAEQIIDNPAPVLWGNFGMHLSTGDGNSDGIDDLYVSAIGNTGSGVPVAGEIYFFPGPVDPLNYSVVVDPNPNPSDLPGPRFGMHIDARDDLLAVCANRKDWNGVMDAGQGYVYSPPGFSNVTLHEHPTPLPADYMGFRCSLANLVGDATLDVAFVTMPNRFLPNPNPYAIFIWDGSNLAGAPRQLVALGGSADHFGNGLLAAQLIPGGYEELIVGDPTYDTPASVPPDNVGRVVLYY